MLDTVEIKLSLACTVKRDGRDRWVTGCPVLDIFSQGKNPQEAKRSLEEAISLWVEDCLERGTLEDALRDAGFYKVHPTELRAYGADDEDATPIVSHALQDNQPAKDTFSLHISIPAYQAPALLAS